MIVFAITGDGFLFPLELFGSIWWGEMMADDAGAIAAGAGTLLVLSLVFGLIYSFLITYVRIEPLITGLVYGVAVWLITYYVIGAAVDFFTDDFPVWSLLVGSAFFGLTLGAFEDWADRNWSRGMRGAREMRD
jgi:ribose/xylose/arabinose/galactoside ABC-type transport system permease subunit